MYNVICAIAKNENNYINDWIKWHIDLGFDHIYVFDNDDKTSPYVAYYVDDAYRSKVTFFDKRGIHEHAMQIKYYNDFYQKHNKEFDWCAFIDVDEFINLRDWKTVSEFLNDSRFKKYDIIRLKWHLYGDDDKLFRDIRIPVNQYFKIEVKNNKLANQGKHIIRGNLQKHVNICSCHYSYIDGVIKNTCLPNGLETTNTITITDHYDDCAYINHYMTKTISEFYNQKCNRGDAVFDKRIIDWNYFWKINTKTAVKQKFTALIEKQPTLWYYSSRNNAGDIFTKFLFEKLGIKTKFVDNTNADIIATGSILQQVKSQNTYTLGSGFHNDSNVFKGNIKKILGVRGNLTLQKLNTSCINVCLGDPGLLLSYFFKPTSTKKYKYGIIAHGIDYTDFEKYNTKNCPIINMYLKDSSMESFMELINKINECEFIFSSSLHGIIFAHSLGIPAIHIENKPLMSKDNFKFKDYYSIFNTMEYKKLVYTPNFVFLNLYNEIKTENLKPTNSELKHIQENLIQMFIGFVDAYMPKTDIKPTFVESRQDKVKNLMNQKTKLNSFINMMMEMEQAN